MRKYTWILLLLSSIYKSVVDADREMWQMRELQVNKEVVQMWGRYMDDVEAAWQRMITTKSVQQVSVDNVAVNTQTTL